MGGMKTIICTLAGISYGVLWLFGYEAVVMASIGAGIFTLMLKSNGTR